MLRTRNSPEQIAFALQQFGNGTPVLLICRKMRIAEQSLYHWKKRYVTWEWRRRGV